MPFVIDDVMPTDDVIPLVIDDVMPLVTDDVSDGGREGILIFWRGRDEGGGGGIASEGAPSGFR